MNYRIAYIDESDSWINTFYHTFKNDFEVFKFKVDNNSTVDSLIKELYTQHLDAIVTDYLLEEEGGVWFNGNKIVSLIKQHHPHFPLIMLTSHQPEAISHSDDVHIIYSKDIISGENEKELEVFKSKMISNISSYYKKIEDTNMRIAQLVEKRNIKGLEILEEEELTKLYMLYDELNPDGKEIPTNLIQKESITQLNEFVKEAKDILAELKKINKK